MISPFCLLETIQVKVLCSTSWSLQLVLSEFQSTIAADIEHSSSAQRAAHMFQIVKHLIPKNHLGSKVNPTNRACLQTTFCSFLKTTVSNGFGFVLFHLQWNKLLFVTSKSLTVRKDVTKS